MTAPTDQVWRDPQVIDRYLTGVRGGIPLAAEQIRTLVRLVRAAVPAPRRFLDLGCGDGVLGRALLAEWPEAEGLFVDFHIRSATVKGRDAIEQEYYRRADKAANRLASAELQCQWLREIGFERVDCFFKLFELALFGGIRPAVNPPVPRAETLVSRP